MNAQPTGESAGGVLRRRQAELRAVMEFLADFHGEVNDSQVLFPEDYRAAALSLLDAIEAARLSDRSGS